MRKGKFILPIKPGFPDAPADGKIYGRKDSVWTEVVGGGSASGIFDKDYEFCIIAGVAETLVCDLYAVFPYTITKLIIESDGTLNGVNLKIGATAVTGLSSITVGALAVIDATAANEVVETNRVTLNTTTSYSGAPTIVKAKIVYTR